MSNKAQSIIYFIILFVIFYGISSHYIASVPVAFAREEAIAFTPSIFEMIVSLLLSLILPFVILYFGKVERINSFLKPTRWKVIPSIILYIIVLVFVFGRELLWFTGGFFHYFVKYLTFNSTAVFGGMFEFMELLFPLIAYYVIVCAINQFVSKNQQVA